MEIKTTTEIIHKGNSFSLIGDNDYHFHAKWFNEGQCPIEWITDIIELAEHVKVYLTDKQQD